MLFFSLRKSCRENALARRHGGRLLGERGGEWRPGSSRALPPAAWAPAGVKRSNGILTWEKGAGCTSHLKVHVERIPSCFAFLLQHSGNEVSPKFGTNIPIFASFHIMVKPWKWNGVERSRSPVQPDWCKASGENSGWHSRGFFLDTRP